MHSKQWQWVSDDLIIAMSGSYESWSPIFCGGRKIMYRKHSGLDFKYSSLNIIVFHFPTNRIQAQILCFFFLSHVSPRKVRCQDTSYWVVQHFLDTLRCVTHIINSSWGKMQFVCFSSAQQITTMVLLKLSKKLPHYKTLTSTEADASESHMALLLRHFWAWSTTGHTPVSDVSTGVVHVLWKSKVPALTWQIEMPEWFSDMQR